MPLAFSSLSHGTIAFGFYNIETDALLLDRLFFYCTDFCRAVCELERSPRSPEPRVEMPGYVFDEPSRIGDLMGAIRGTRHVGYLGEVYRLWPFPTEAEDFRQRVSGEANRAISEDLLRRWASPQAIALCTSPGEGRYRIGPYEFSERVYGDLLAYVWRGGHPTWEGLEEGRRPECVKELSRTVALLRARIGPVP
jgi:hypothetical protein